MKHTIETGEVHLAYDIRSLEILNKFLTGILEMLGTSIKTQQNIQVIAEEILAHVLFNHKSPAENELVVVKSRFLAEESLELQFHYMGKPIRKNELLQYNKNDFSDDNLDKLWCLLARKLSDSFEIINLGNDGWRIICSKKLEGAFYSKRMPENISSEMTSEKKREKLIYRIAEPEDAFSLVELTHKTYAYSYAEPDFYYAERLAEALKKQSIVSVIAESEESGEIVAHAGIMYYPSIPHCGELGMLMVAPEYQGTRAAFNVGRRIIELSEHPPFKKDLFYSVFTTAHTISQRMGEKLSKLMPTMLMLSSCPMADYEQSSDGSPRGRESLLFAIRLMFESKSRVFIPIEHKEIMINLFKQVNADIEISSQTFSDYASDTKITIYRFDLSFSANLVIDSFSQNWVDKIRKTIYSLRCEGIKTIYIQIPAWRPIPENLRETMKSLNAVFTGTPIFSKDNWYLAYAALDSEKINFDKIVIYNEKAKHLLNHIKSEFEYVFMD